jgi:ribosomal protein L4
MALLFGEERCTAAILRLYEREQSAERAGEKDQRGDGAGTGQGPGRKKEGHRARAGEGWMETVKGKGRTQGEGAG